MYLYDCSPLCSVYEDAVSDAIEGEDVNLLQILVIKNQVLVQMQKKKLLLEDMEYFVASYKKRVKEDWWRGFLLSRAEFEEKFCRLF